MLQSGGMAVNLSVGTAWGSMVMDGKDKNQKQADDPSDALSSGLSHPERQSVRESMAGSARVVHEMVRQEGIHEMERPTLSLAISGLAAGLAISVSVLMKGAIEAEVGATGYGFILASFGYSLGFVIVILGQMQLFTENTVVPVIVVAHTPTPRNFARLLRLWTIVLAANLVGTFIAAVAIDAGILTSAAVREQIMHLSRKALEPGAADVLTRGIPAGFLMGAIAWTLPSAKGQEFWVVLAFTTAISLGGFTHVIAGSAEGFLLVLAGEVAIGPMLSGFLLPALAGNVLGGTVLFALLAHGQVSRELD